MYAKEKELDVSADRETRMVVVGGGAEVVAAASGEGVRKTSR